MTSNTENYISETLKQGERFKKYQSKIVQSQEKDIKNLMEGFETNSNAISRSTRLENTAANVQDYAMILNQYQTNFASTLERYKTAKAQLMSTTKNFIKNNQTAASGSIANKNIFVSQVTSNPSSEYVGAYKDNVGSPAINPKMSGQYTYDECQLAAINNGKQFFALSNSNSTTQKASCALTNDLSSAEKYGSAGSNCQQGSDGFLYGGKSTNALYQVPDTEFVGNYGDNPNRAMPTFANGGSRTYTYDTCKQAAKNGGFKFFGLQWYSGGNNGYAQCSLSNDFSQATKYGQSGSRSVNGQGKVVGGGWANAIYQVQASDNNTFIGCYKDNESSPSMTLVASNATAASCQQAAIMRGNKYFALQGGSQGSSKCFVSNSLSESTKYGISNPTDKFSDNKNYGNVDVNAIYKVTSKGYYENLGKMGYVDNTGLLTEYPKPMIQMVNGVPSIVNSNESCSKDHVSVDSNFWQNQKKSSNMMTPSTKCGLSSAIQADKASVAELGDQLNAMSANIVSLIKYLETLDDAVIKQMGLNKETLNSMLAKHAVYNSKFTQYTNTDINNYDTIMEDRKIVTAQQNFNYILWSGVTIVILIIALQVIKRTST
jgi:hypothetical protein